ncbi:MAG: SCO family protein [Pseudomonadota bacterium]
MKALRGLRVWSALAGLLVAGMVITVLSGAAADRSGLARMGQAPDFTLPNADGGMTSLAELRGKVVLVNFMFTKCPDYCPTLTAVLANVQDELIAEGLGDDVHFISVTVDPANDTPELLNRYAEAMYVAPEGWSFTTGAPDQIERVASDYGVFFRRLPSGSVEHNLLTTVVDRDGVMRVQYVGERFDPDELITDIRNLAGGLLRII